MTMGGDGQPMTDTGKQQRLSGAVGAGKPDDRFMPILPTPQAAVLANIYNNNQGFRDRMGSLARDPVGFFRGAVQDVTPTPKELLSAFAQVSNPTLKGTVMMPEADEGKRKLMDLALAGQTVFHGSPYKFDKFDMSKVGTGEGAQAYGHGMYFAESRDAAAHYQNALAPQQNKLGGQKVWQADIDDGAKQLLIGESGDIEKAVQVAKDALHHWTKTEPSFRNREASQKTLDALLNIQASGTLERNMGALYKVDLPDEHIAKMLDWDKPLSEQPKGVTDALKNAGIYPGQAERDSYISSLPKNARATAERMLDAPPKSLTDGTHDASWKQLQKLAPAVDHNSIHDIQALVADARNGEYFYRKFGDTPTQASERLRGVGIPGIRYLDGGSRGKGQGTYNYVVFDDNLPKIVGRE